MKPIKKFVIARYGQDHINDNRRIVLYIDEYQEEFDTEEDAIGFAFNDSKYTAWIILPVIRFDNWEAN